MLAGGIVEPGGGSAGRVSAFVAYNPRPGVSRLFKVSGSAADPVVSELPSATTVDLSAFRHELEQELSPEVRAIGERGGAAAITQPKPEWIASVVRRHLKDAEGVEVG